MSTQYSNLIEKLERQSSHSLKDKMEVQYQLRDIGEKTHSMLSNNNKALRIIIFLQILNTSANHSDVVLPFIKLLL